MHAYLLVTQGLSDDADISALIDDAKIILRYRIEKITDTKELIRDTNVSLKQKTAFILEDFGKASMEAQNAFLKRLEEPQENAVFVLTAGSEEAVLPTIVSRCEVVRVKPHFAKATLGAREQAREFVDSDVAGRFSVVSKITKREDAVEFLENITYSLHQEFYDNPHHKNAVGLADQALYRINKNANPTLQLTAFAISF